MNRKRSVLNDIYKQKRAKLNASGFPCSAELPNDTKGALLFLKSLFPLEKFQGHLPPIIMQHQIYAFVLNRTEVDKELNDLRQKGDIRMFKLGGSEDEIAVVFMEDYKRHVDKRSGNNVAVGSFMSKVVTKCPDISYSKEVLLQEYLLKEENISELVQHGILTARDVGCYWLSIPQAGEFMKAFLSGRRATLQYVRRTKYKEILQSELEQRKLPRKALLGILYHIYDIVGADLVKCVETSTGKLLRLPSESQSVR